MAQARFEDLPTCEARLATFEASYIEDLKDSCICPITQEVIGTAAYYISHGIKRYFEEKYIREWIRDNGTCPISRAPISSDMLVRDPDHFARLTNFNTRTGETEFIATLDDPAFFMVKEFIYTIRLGDIENFRKFSPYLSHYINKVNYLTQLYSTTNGRDGINLWPALHNAVMRTYKNEHDTLEIINALLAAGADVAGKTPGGLNPLILAIQNQKPAIVKALLDAGANPNLPVGPAHLYPLEIACRSNFECVKLLLNSGANVNASVGAGNTVLHQVVSVWGTDRIVALLLQHGALVNVVNHKGDTPLHNAVQIKSNEAIVALLLAAGADISIANKNCKRVSEMKPANYQYYPNSYDAGFKLIDSTNEVKIKEMITPPPAIHELPPEDPKVTARKLEIEASIVRLQEEATRAQAEVAREAALSEARLAAEAATIASARAAEDASARAAAIAEEARIRANLIAEEAAIARARAALIEEEVRARARRAAERPSAAADASPRRVAELARQAEIDRAEAMRTAEIELERQASEDDAARYRAAIEATRARIAAEAVAAAPRRSDAEPIIASQPTAIELTRARVAARARATAELTFNEFLTAYQTTYQKAGFFHRNPFSRMHLKLTSGEVFNINQVQAYAANNPHTRTSMLLEELIQSKMRTR